MVLQEIDQAPISTRAEGIKKGESKSLEGV